MIPLIQSMNTPKTREEFEYRFHLLYQSLKDDKISFPPNMGESLFRLRALPNGRLDFLSVDELARLQANMMLQFADWQHLPQNEEEQYPAEDS